MRLRARPTRSNSSAILCALAGVVGTALQANRDVGWVGLVLWAALLGTIAALVARALEAFRVPVRAATIAGCTLILLYAFVDFLDVRLFAQHIDRAQFLAALSAVRTRSVRVGVVDVAVPVVALAVVVGVLFGLERLLETVLPRRRTTGIGAVLAVVAILVLFTRDAILPKDSAPFFWHAQGPVVTAGAGEGTPFRVGSDLVAAEASVLREIATNPASLEVSIAEPHPKSILFVHVESLRADMLNETNMPKTFPWSKRAWSAPHHYSTGNNTVGGFFGAISGLNASYFYAATSTSAPAFRTLPLVALARLGYERHVWFPNAALRLDDMVEKIVGPLASIHAVEAAERTDAGRETVRSYLASVAATAGSGLRFDYLALDSTHYEYAYPKDFERFTPVSSFGVVVDNGVVAQVSPEERVRMRDERGAGVYNAYRNSVLWTDSLIDELLGELERTGRLQNTIVAVFGDHGEAFWEHSAWGHSTRFDEQQVRTPLLLFPPPGKPVQYEVTSHADIMPTVLAMLGVHANRAFMNGKSLLDYDRARDFALLRTAIGGDNDDHRNAIVFGGMKLVFFDGAEPKVIAVRHVNDDDWPDAPPALLSRAMAAAITAKELH